MKNRFLALFILLLICVTAVAQTIKYNFETTATCASDETPPTWHLSMRQGLSGDIAKFGYTRAGFSGQHTINNKWELNWGADVVAGYNLTSTAYIQQAFADIRWKIFTLSIGQKEGWGEMKNHRISTGALVESGNARPIPQVRLEVPEYYDFFGTNGWFKLRGHLAYGYLTDGSWQKDWVAPESNRTKNVLYHSKAIFFKLGKEERFPLTFEWGLHMVAQFGGTLYNKNGEVLSNPTRLKDFYKVLIPSSGDNEYSGLDIANVAGNHLGSWHGALNCNLGKWDIRAYYEHLFDDHSQMFMEYGLWTEQLVGIEIASKNFNWIKAVSFEYYNLKNQSGPVYHDTTDKIPDQISCRDDNYNHEWYNGWFNYGMTIGTPLATSPIYNANRVMNCYNNRVEAFHIGVEGEPTHEIAYRLLFTHSNNWGTYNDPFTEIRSNNAGLVEIAYKPEKLKGWAVKASYAFDNGSLLGNCRSGLFTISKSGIINLKSRKK